MTVFSSRISRQAVRSAYGSASRTASPLALAATLAMGAGVMVAPTVFASSAFAASAPSADTPLTLKTLKITGNSQVATSDIDAAVPFHVGDTVTQTQIAAGLQDVMGVYKAKNVGASFGQKLKFIGKNVEVEWQIGEQAAAGPAKLVVDSVAFSGNKKVSSDELAAATKLRPGSEVTNESVSADQQAIQGVYKAKGVSAGIGMTPNYPSPNHVVITWTITEKSGD
ncbi:hypothetical protein J2D73_05360 [Acetobacter sacchari]|uniref:POTRA domain-containing protein n=1 Tax=Acetobacter sacchari TaxID=2661687 RepID=A0ABS3LTJ4_9PROT|nr:POTRA domain-containing protein [Acetobacter sacchari]MBO1359224.1 hypothetical protein [Acetobacter sacchari]